MADEHNTDFHDVIARLEAEAKTLETRRDGFRAKEREASQALKRVRKSIATLRGESGSANSVTDADVREFALGVIRRGAPVPREKLSHALMAHVKAKGLSGVGAHLALSRVLSAEPFEETAQGFRLRAS